jgi:exodeoxyribonuclease VII small subunit
MPDDLSGLSYEAALAELDTIIAQLERGDVQLEAAIAAYERGAALTRHCTSLLDRTEQKVTQLVVSAAGEEERPLAIATDRAEPVVPAPAHEVPRARSVEQRLFGAAQSAPPGPVLADDADDIPF